MPARFTLHINKLFDGLILPISQEHTNALYFDVGLYCDQTNVFFGWESFPFTKELNQDMTFTMFRDDSAIPVREYLPKSNSARLVRLPRGCKTFSVHLYKIVATGKKQYGTVRHISGGSVDQDEAIFKCISLMDINQSFLLCGHSYYSLDLSDHYDFQYKSRPMQNLSVPNNPDRRWLVQREFYGSMNCAKSYHERATQTNTILRAILIKMNPKRYSKSLLHFLINFCKCIYKNLDYVNDQQFSDELKDRDLGDALLYFTKQGDCEDFAHYFVRMILHLVNMVCCLPDQVFANTKAAKLIKEFSYQFKMKYIPMIYVCQIINGHDQLEYHSTILCIPSGSVDGADTGGFAKPIGIELTDPEQSDYCTCEEFSSWHTQHFFLLTNYHIFVFSDTESTYKLKDNDRLPLYKFENLIDRFRDY